MPPDRIHAAPDAELTFWLVWLTLVFALPAMIAVTATLRRRARMSVASIAFATSAVLIATMLIRSSGLEFTAATGNYAIASIGYLAYCGLFATLWSIRPIALRIVVAAVAALPILGGYLLASFGLLGLMTVLDIRIEDPVELEANRVCTVAWSGGAAADDVATVTLYQRWQHLPFLRRVLATYRSDTTAAEEPLTCAEAHVRYKTSGGM